MTSPATAPMPSAPLTSRSPMAMTVMMPSRVTLFVPMARRSTLLLVVPRVWTLATPASRNRRLTTAMPSPMTRPSANQGADNSRATMTAPAPTTMEETTVRRRTLASAPPSRSDSPDSMFIRRPPRKRASSRAEAERRLGGDGCGITGRRPRQDRGEPDLVPQMEVVVGSGPVRAEADAHATREQLAQRRHPRTELPVRTGAVRHGDVALDDEREVGLVQPHRVCGEHPAVECADRLQHRRRTPSVPLLHQCAFRLGLREMDLQQGVPPLRLSRDLLQAFGRHRVHR